MLIDTREPPPGDEGLPAWEPNWAVWGRAAAAVFLGIAATETAGAASVLLIFAAFAAACSAAATAFDYWAGLREWRQ